MTREVRDVRENAKKAVPGSRLIGVMRVLWLGMGLIGMLRGSTDFWDLPPIRYADGVATDRMAALAVAVEEGRMKWPEEGGLETLKMVLAWLEVPEESQVLVFSKTSKQIGRIRPDQPRALYFSLDSYVGYVPGGAVEVVTQDPVLGPVFYLVERNGAAVEVVRDRSDCLSCHGTTRTEGVPGVLVRSVFPDQSGHSIGRHGSIDVRGSTPLTERWGGYYVTGRSSFPHLGNRVFEEDEKPEAALEPMLKLAETVDLSRYLRATSDIVALMVLEHQCEVHNALTEASFRYQRARFLAQAIDPAADPDAGQAGRIAEHHAAKVVDLLLFKNEADVGEDLVGDEAFQDAYQGMIPSTEQGSLADFRLYRRIFKHGCSPMIYSKAFRTLPPRVKAAVIKALAAALAERGDDRAAKRLRAILAASVDGWPRE